ncbi:type VI secretion system baseplate subunit TssF [Alteromonas sp. ASW11-130]|uniref:type VI secretion system baseplate subunit TssF n=1 Tax=Alteromonas sp. ASW11-130 TaxID=3015775 RepID=UPI0022429C11|nr:type VI secretion system baseplate subunit TssF [Alteromonas sp. ASW11-130]MCW8092785.1 type VI secretion system baseplate subunit TssF [Alteromonas sp. ASW11-130]
MASNRYFEDELNYLRELGAEFANRNPNLAKFLGEEGDDPDVERLLEGVAFLTGRIREKLDHESPELTHSLLDMVWPNYLRPVPAMTILQFTPRLHVLTEEQRIERGTEVQSVDVDGTPCRFRTCYNVDVAPLSVESVDIFNKAKRTHLAISLKLDAGIASENISLGALRFYLHDEQKIEVSNTLYLCFFRYLDCFDVNLTMQDGQTIVLNDRPSDLVRRAGFGDEESLLPEANYEYSGNRLLQEYFQFQQKFRFIEIGGFEQVFAHTEISDITLIFKFSKLLVDSVNKDNFKLYCTPIVNLFENEGKPIRIDNKKIEYLLRPEAANVGHYDIFSINHVQGRVKSKRQHKIYYPYETFQHYDEMLEHDTTSFYKHRRGSSVIYDGYDHFLYFDSQVEGYDNGLENEVVTTQLTCTNGSLPNKLRSGQIAFDSGNSPDFVTFSNIESATYSLAPPSNDFQGWAMLSRLSANYNPLSSLHAIRNLIKVFDLPAKSDRRKERLNLLIREGIERLETRHSTRLVKGMPIAGLITTINVRESKFGAKGVSGEANMYLFASVLYQYLSRQASINSFHNLEVLAIESGEKYRWGDKFFTEDYE